GREIRAGLQTSGYRLPEERRQLVPVFAEAPSLKPGARADRDYDPLGFPQPASCAASGTSASSCSRVLSEASSVTRSSSRCSTSPTIGPGPLPSAAITS